MLPSGSGVRSESLLLASVLLQLCIVLSDQATCISDIHASFSGGSRRQLGSSGAVPAAFSCVPPMPACMSAMQAAQSGSTVQWQKHAAVAEPAQPAFVLVVVTHSLSNLNDIVYLWLP